MYFFLSLTIGTSLKFLENLSFLVNSLSSNICSSIETTNDPSYALITKHSVFGEKHFNSPFKYG